MYAAEAAQAGSPSGRRLEARAHSTLSRLCLKRRVGLFGWLFPFTNSHLIMILKDQTIELYIKEKMKVPSALQRGNHGNRCVASKIFSVLSSLLRTHTRARIFFVFVLIFYTMGLFMLTTVTTGTRRVPSTYEVLPKICQVNEYNIH